MAWHNVQVTVEVMVEADSPEEAKEQAKGTVNQALEFGMRGSWYYTTKAEVVHTREE